MLGLALGLKLLRQRRRPFLTGELPGKDNAHRVPVGKVNIEEPAPGCDLRRSRVVRLATIYPKIALALDIQEPGRLGLLAAHKVEYSDGAHSIANGLGAAHIVDVVIIRRGARGRLSTVVREVDGAVLSIRYV